MQTLADHLNAGSYFTASADSRTLAFVAEKPDSPGDIWSLAANQPPRQLTTLNPQIASLKLGNVREVSWTNRKNGQVLRGVLVTPPDFKSGRPYPVIVEAHPGIAAWWSGWQGSWVQWAQLLASNGYVVFLPNPRGVVGQVWKSAEISHTWIPGDAFEDTMDGVDSLIEQKIADPERLGIGGWSNGGLMTAWAITHTNRFKAAVPFAALVDFLLLWDTSSADIAQFAEKTFGGTPLNARSTYSVQTHIVLDPSSASP